MAITREYTYSVRGTGRFPLDQLRYEWARARQSEDSRKIENSLRSDRPSAELVTVQLVGLNKPSERWGSFGWLVSDVDSRKVA